MRNLSFNNELVRIAQARLKFTDYRPRWNGSVTAEERAFYDAGVYGAGNFFQVRISGGYLQDFYNGSWRNHATHAAHANSWAYIFEGYVFYLNTSGNLVYSLFNGTTFGTPTATARTFIGVPVSMTEMYRLTNGRVEHLNITTGAVTTSPDTIYNAVHYDAVKVGSIGYIYVSDGRRTWYVKHEQGRFSEPKLLIPMDVVDDITLFDLGGVSVLDGKVVITGIMKRTYLDKTLHVMLVGPERADMGREMIVGATALDQTYPSISLPMRPGKLYRSGTNLRYHARQYYAQTVLPRMFGGAPANTQITVSPSQASISYTANQAPVLQAELRASDAHAAIRTSSRVELEVKIGANFERLGIFNVDVIHRPKDENTTRLMIVARSEAFKKLDQWESDAPFDLWSQTKLSADAGELTKVIRTKGRWVQQDTALYVDRMNVNGQLYLTSKSCESGIIRASITPTGTSEYKFGLGMYYQFESKVEASLRSGKSAVEIGADNLRPSGLFVMYHNGAVTIQHLNIGYFHTLTNLDNSPLSAPLTLNAGTKYWVQAMFRCGRVTVHYREDSSFNWVEVMNVIPKYGQLPWENKIVGRGAIYAENISEWAYTPGFASNVNIPVSDPAKFPNSAVMTMGSEQMVSSGVEGAPVWTKEKVRLGGDKVFASTLSGNTARLAWSSGFPDYYPSYYDIYFEGLDEPYVINSFSVMASRSAYHTPEYQSTMKLRAYIREADVVLGEPFPWPATWSRQQFELHNKEFREPTIKTGVERWTTNYANVDVVAWQGPCIIRLVAPDNMPSEWYQFQMGEYKGQVVPAFQLTATPYASFQAAKVTENSVFWYRSRYPVNGKITAMKVGGQTYDYSSGNSFSSVRLGFDDVWEAGLVRSSLMDANVPYILPGEMEAEFRWRTIIPSARGHNDTKAISHSAGIISQYRDLPAFTIHKVEFFSTDIDMSLADVAREICGKVGVELVTDQMRPSALASGNNFFLPRGALIVVYDAGNHTLGSVDFRPWLTSQSIVGHLGPYLAIHPDRLEYRRTITGSDICVERFPISQSLAGKVRVSFYDDTMSVWNNDRLIHSFHLHDQDRRESTIANYINIQQTTGQNMTFDIPYACQRIDNYILDNGKKGSGLLTELAGKRKIYFTETADGKIRLFRSRSVVNTSGTAYRLAVATGKVETDVPIATRMRLEGGEVHETISDVLWEHGNIFTIAHIPEINNLEDVGYFADILLEEAANEYGRRELTGGADFRIEPQDLVYVQWPEGVDLLIVDTIAFVLSTSEDSAAVDMTVQFRGATL
jgi:hypothetical protein